MPQSRVAHFAARAEPFLYAALRIVAGALFFVHGAQKVLGWHATHTVNVGSQLWFGGVIELVGGTLIALGMFTRCAAFVCAGEMAVAYLQFHWRFSFDDGNWLPVINKGELAVVYCFLFLFIAARGGGALSMDGRRRRP